MKSKIFTISFILFAFFSNFVFAQKESYTFDSVFDSIGSPHGITTDFSGNIWIGSNGDSVGIKVFKPNKEKLPFSPIWEVSIGGQKYNVAKGCRGMTTDSDGNILVCIGSQLIKINAKDGSGMKYKNLGGSLTKPAADKNGRIYVTKVVGPATLWILNSNFDSIGVVEKETGVWSRAVEVTPDGKDVYIGSLWHHVVQHYHSDDLKTYTLKDSLPYNFEGDTPGLNLDKNGNLWISEYQSGRGFDKLFIYNLATGKKDSLLGFGDSVIFSPRGVAFSLTGDTIYVTSYDVGLVQRWIKSKVTGVNENYSTIPEKYNLLQNYPNPFNPSTTISFDLPKISNVKIEIYNSLGQKIKTLLNSTLEPGNHKVVWNGRDDYGNNVSSGIYFYSLKSDNITISKKMMLIK